MSDEPKIHAFQIGNSEPIRLGIPGQYMSRATAEKALRDKFRSPPPELRNVQEVTLIEYDDDDKPIAVGPVRVRQTPREIGRELAQQLLGNRVTVSMPGRIR